MFDKKLHNLKTKSILVMLLICFCLPLLAQTDSTSVILSEQQAVQKKVDFRIPEKEKIEKFKKDPRFDYSRSKKEGLSLWDKFLQWLYNWFGSMAQKVNDTGILGVVILIAIILLLSLLILKFVGVNYRALLGRKEIKTSEIDIYTENVHEMNFDVLISNALRNQDYRLAVRFLYLKNLKQLSDKLLIKWSPHKTNYSYQYEIENQTLRSKFLETTFIFDYIWYGEFPLDEAQFSDINNRMNNLNKMISDER